MAKSRKGAFVGLANSDYRPFPGSIGSRLCPMPNANFHEKAHFVKADVADPFVVERYDSVSFAMLPSALLMSQLSSDPVHYEILLFGLLLTSAQTSKPRSLAA